jgi:anaerobic magnesium-protoporphyrin IX monomethyl ester cyclase
MRVLLVFPETRYPTGQLPLGIAYLAGALRSQQGVDVECLDTSLVDRPFRHLADTIRSRRYELIGFSVTTPQLGTARRMARLAKTIAPGCQIVLGGAHPSVMPRETLHWPWVDTVVIGEGEETLVELVQRGGDPAGVAGLWYRDDHRIVENPRRPYVSDLDRLPLPARELFPMQTYVRNWYSLDTVSPGLRGTSLVGSRGCPYRCSFCQPTISTLFGRAVRKRSPGSIIAELEMLIATYRIEAFMFEDSTFVLDAAWVRDICQALIEADLGLVWGCNVRADLLDHDLLAMMHRAGLRKVNLGIESASERVLSDIYQKGITLRQVDQVVTWARELRIRVQGYFILGAPTETKDEMLRTVRYARELDIDDAVFDIATPFPHTVLYEMSRQQIRSDLADFDCFHRCVYGDRPEASARFIETLKTKAYYLFYLHPRRLPWMVRQGLSPVTLRRTLLKARRV